MTKKDIVRTIAEQIDLPQLRTKDLVQKTFDALIDALVKEGRIELRNFGVFQIKRREARMARNPRTGEKVPVQAKSVVTFKPGKEMEARVRELDREMIDRARAEAPPVAHASGSDGTSRIVPRPPVHHVGPQDVLAAGGPRLGHHAGDRVAVADELLLHVGEWWSRSSTASGGMDPGTRPEVIGNQRPLTPPTPGTAGTRPPARRGRGGGR